MKKKNNLLDHLNRIQDRKRPIRMDDLRDAHNKCIEAVEYVGSANYEEREREAISKVDKVFKKLMNKCEGTK